MDLRREELVKEALSWNGKTKFAHGQCLKGVAADCSTYIAACYRSVGLFKADIPVLPPDWFVHTTKQHYLEELMKHTVEFTLKEKTPEPGDIVIVKDIAIGAKVYSHGAIILFWGIEPRVIHCFPPCVMISNPYRFPAFAGKPLKFFDPFKEH
jgi:cell wall-associated NlpC family hydrolase